ncbi:MAG: YbhB/YbcL family Raf kinase inhibitor-like protein [Vicinamibacterales bacterium]
MTTRRIARVLVTTGLLGVAAVATAQAQTPAPAKQGFTLTSPAFPDGGEIPAKYTQANPSGAVSLPLQWSNAPAGTVSFVLMFHDPDVAYQKKVEDILHYMVVNIPGTATSLAEGVPAEANLPDGSIQPKNFRGVPGYLGPGAPAPGPHHHYTWMLYALDTKLAVGADATRAQVVEAMNGHILGKAVFFGRFHR